MVSIFYIVTSLQINLTQFDKQKFDKASDNAFKVLLVYY